MAALITTPNLEGADDIYAALVGLTAGLGEAESLRVQAKLILLLANHIGERAVIEEAISISRPTDGKATA
ncbi:DUF2783 domain-containing protein [soil metagenome]